MVLRDILIASGRANAHPHVEGCNDSKHKSFGKLKDAREYIRKTTWCLFLLGDWGKPTYVDGFPGACHECFMTRHEAERFVEYWKESLAEVWRRER